MLTIDKLKNSFNRSAYFFKATRNESALALDYYHNDQWTDEELNTISKSNQYPETYNIIKMYAHLIVGYWSTMANTVKVTAKTPADVEVATVLNDIITEILMSNSFKTESDKMKLDGALQGIMVAFVAPKNTGKKDRWGQPIYSIEVQHVPADEVLLDPASIKDDYSDGNFLHRFKWLTAQELLKIYPGSTIDTLEPNTTGGLFIDGNESALDVNLAYLSGKDNDTKQTNYFVVHTVIKEGKDTWSIHWSGKTILSKRKITYKEVKFPYRVQKIITRKAKFFSIFKDILGTQKTINQALIKFQKLINTKQVFFEGNAVKDASTFTSDVGKINSVIQVKRIDGIQIINNSASIKEQYDIITVAIARCENVLGINKSFLGQAYASDSGKKVKLQQNATELSFQLVTNRVENFYSMLGMDIMHLIKQYYTAEQTIVVSDEYEGKKFLEINKPMEKLTLNENNEITKDVATIIKHDPETDEPMINEDTGELLVVPLIDKATGLQFADTDITIEAVVENQEEAKSMTMIENALNGAGGNMLAERAPASYLRMQAILIRGLKLKDSNKLASIYNKVAEDIGGGMPNE